MQWYCWTWLTFLFFFKELNELYSLLYLLIGHKCETYSWIKAKESWGGRRQKSNFKNNNHAIKMKAPQPPLPTSLSPNYKGASYPSLTPIPVFWVSGWLVGVGVLPTGTPISRSLTPLGRGGAYVPSTGITFFLLLH